MPPSNYAHMPLLLSLCSRALEQQLLSPCALEPVLHNKRSHCDKEPARCNKRKPTHSNRDSAAKNELGDKNENKWEVSPYT